MTASRPTRGTAWFSDGDLAYVIDCGDVQIAFEADWGSTGEVNARGWPIADESVVIRRRVVIEGDVNLTQHADPTVAQDALDGAALRRLREAAPDWGQTIFRSVSREARAPGLKDVECTIVIYPPDSAHQEIRGGGATLAKAADECREALTRVLESKRPREQSPQDL